MENTGAGLARVVVRQRSVKTTLLAIAIPVLALAAPRAADACGPVPCWQGYFVPGDAAHVPANLAAVYWRPMSSAAGPIAADPSRVVLTSTADPGKPLPFTATALANGDFLLVLDAPLTAGTSYTITDGSTCTFTGEHGPHAMFTAGPAAPLPTRLGTLVVTDGEVGALEVATASGSCSNEVSADRSTFVLAPATDAQPWLDVLQFETIVDGTQWRVASSINQTLSPGASWHGRGSDLLYRVCKTTDTTVDQGLAAGTHDVELRATLPGTPVMLTSDSATVALACTADPEAECTGGATCKPDQAGCSASGASGAPWLVVALGLLLCRRRRGR